MLWRFFMKEKQILIDEFYFHIIIIIAFLCRICNCMCSVGDCLCWIEYYCDMDFGNLFSSTSSNEKNYICTLGLESSRFIDL